jgi:hypothetical protein
VRAARLPASAPCGTVGERLRPIRIAGRASLLAYGTHLRLIYDLLWMWPFGGVPKASHGDLFFFAASVAVAVPTLFLAGR